MSTWPMVKLGEVCEIRKETLSDFSTVWDLSFVGLENLNQGGGFGNLPRVGEVAPKSTKNIYQSGDILFGKLRPNLRKAALAFTDGICSTDIVVVKPSSKVDAQFLYSVLLTDFFYSQVKIHVNGINLPRISAKRLLELQIPLPPLEEQKRIAGILEASARQVRSAELLIEDASSVITSQYEKIQKSSNCVISLRNLGVKNISGKSLVAKGGCEHPVNKVLKVSAVSSGEFLPYEVKPLPDDYLPPENHEVHEGDILFARASGSQNLLGACVKARGVKPHTYIPDKIWRLEFDEEKTSGEYLLEAIKSPKFRAIAESQFSSSTGVKNIKSSVLLGYEVPVPQPIDLEEFNSVARQSDEVVGSLRQKLVLLQELHQSLTTRAFAGEL